MQTNLFINLFYSLEYAEDLKECLEIECSKKAQININLLYSESLVNIRLKVNLTCSKKLTVLVYTAEA